MKRKNIKNDKVLRAITIGLATMIAATSAPLNVYAAEDQQSGDDVENVDPKVEENDNAGGGGEVTTIQQTEDNGEAGGEQNNGGEEQQAAPIDVSEVTAADSAIAVAEELVSAPAQADGVMTADAVAAPGGMIPVAETAVEGLLVLPAKGQTAEQTPQLPGVENALDQLKAAAGSVQEVKEDLAGFEAALAVVGQADAAPIETVYSVPAPAQEDGHVENSDNVGQPIPVLETSEPDEYYSDKTPVGGENVDHYDESVNGRKFHSATEDEKPFVKSIVDDYTEAYDNFQNFLSDNSDESKIKAFDAAARADANLTKQENKIKELDEAIKDSAAAEQALKKAKDELETVKTIKTKYDAVMTEYFREMIPNIDSVEESEGLFNNDGSINAENCVKYLEKIKKNNYVTAINNKADAPKDNSKNKDILTPLGRDLFCELVKKEIEGRGGTNVTFVSQKDKNVPVLDKTGSDQGMAEGKVLLNGSGHAYVETVNSTKTLYKIDGDKGIGGRNNRFVVTYTVKDENGNDKTETAFFNYVYKSTKVDTIDGKPVSRGDKLDIENGIFYLAQITQDENGTWVANQVDTLYDDYSLYVNGGMIDTALKAVEDAETKSAELKKAVNAIRDKVLGISREDFESDEDYEKASNDKFAELKLATKYSRVKLNALRELIGERPIVTPGGGGESVGESGDEDGDDDTTGGDEDPGTAGGVVFDPSTGTFSAPAYGFGSTVLPGFTGGPATGVLGVRTDGGAEADEGGVADSRTNVAPRANFGTVNKVLGSRQNKDNSQLAKKIKDNEIPLAEIPNMDDEVTMNWMWLLIIFLLGATGKKMYDEYKKKKEAEEAAKINK